MKIILQKKDYEKILSHAENEIPNEACGLIAGSEDENLQTRTIEKIYLFTNLDKSPEHFSLSPKEQLEAVKGHENKRPKIIRELAFSSGISVKTFSRRYKTGF